MSKRKLVRLTALLFGVSLLLGACSGNGLSSELETIRAELEVLREELAGTKERLAEAQAENRALDDRITDLEAAGEYPIFRQTLDNGVTLIYELGQLDVGYNPLIERRASRLYVRYADGERRQVGGERGLSSISVSPDGTRLLYNDGFAGNFDAADGAAPGSLYVYDFDSRRASWLELDGLREGYTPAFADWLDDRYILFVEQLASGAFTVGGDLCVYDTENDTFRRLTHTARENFQIRSFEIFGRDYLVFNCTQYDEAYIGMDSHPILVMAELYELIRDGKTVDLRERVTDS